MCLRLILILSSHLYLGLPSGLFPSDFPTEVLYPFYISHIRATCPAYVILLHLIIILICGDGAVVAQWYSAGLRDGVPAGAGNSPHQRVQSGTGAHPVYPMSIRGYFSGGKAAGA